MRRFIYPSGNYIIREKSIWDIGLELRDFIEKQGFKVLKYDPENEKKGTLIIATNNEKKSLILEKTSNLASRFTSIFTGDRPLPQSIDFEAQRVGVEFYLWPSEDDIVLEVFVLPYMEHLNRPEIPSISESEVEQITDWCLCESTWETLIPMIKEEFDAKPVLKTM